MFKCNPAKVIFNEELGRGSSGKVYPYRKNPQDNEWIVKYSYLKNFDQLMKLMHEIVLGFSCIHPAVLPLRAYHVEEHKVPGTNKTQGYHLYIKMPRMKSDLRSVLHHFNEQNRSISEEDVIKAFYTLVTGLEYLHGRSIAHRDIKPENILIDGNGHILIADIGSGVLIAAGDTTVTEEGETFGTLAYRSPEGMLQMTNLKKEEYFISDMWSLGLVIAEMCSFKRTMGDEAQEKMDESLNKLTNKYSVSLVDIIKSLLRRDPNERKTAAEIKKTLEDNYPELSLSDELNYTIGFCDSSEELNLAKSDTVINGDLVHRPTLDSLENLSAPPQRFDTSTFYRAQVSNSSLNQTELSLTEKVLLPQEPFLLNNLQIQLCKPKMDQTELKLSSEKIVIKGEIEDILINFFQKQRVIWFEANINSHENQKHLKQLQEKYIVDTFQKLDEAYYHILNNQKHSYYVIASGDSGEELIEKIHKNIRMFCVFCRNVDVHRRWAKKFLKFGCVSDKLYDINRTILIDLLQSQARSPPLRYNFPSFLTLFDHQDLNKIFSHHLYLRRLVHFKDRRQAKADFFSLASHLYPNDLDALKLFKKTYDNYARESILKWFTQESFFYKTLNACLKIATVDSIQYCRLPLKDLEAAIKEQYYSRSHAFHGLVYSVFTVSDSEWNRYRNSIGGEIEAYGFLSASKVKEVATEYAGNDINNKALITIVIPEQNLNEPDEQGFAELEDFSVFKGEREILFNVRSRFTVLEATDGESKETEKTNVLRNLVLVYRSQAMRNTVVADKLVMEADLDDYEKLKQYFNVESISQNEEAYYQYQHEVLRRSTSFGTAIVFIETKNYNHALRYYFEVASSSKADGQKIKANCELALIYATAGKMNDAKKYYEKAISVSKSFLNKTQDATIYHKLGMICVQLLELKKAEEYLRTAENMYNKPKTEIPDDYEVLALYNSFGILYFALGRYEEAEESYNKSIELYNNKGIHPLVAEAYSGLAKIKHVLGQNEIAKDYISKAVEINNILGKEYALNLQDNH